MKKTTLYKIVIVILLLGNCVFIVDYLMKPPPRPKHEGPRDEIIAMLHFDQTQIEKYDLLIKQHQKDIRKAEKGLLEAKRKLYMNLDYPMDGMVLNTVLERQAAIEKIHYAHFQDIKSLCTSKQMVYFKELNKKIADLFSHRMKPPRR